MEARTTGGRKKLYFQYRLQQSDTKIFTFDDIFTETSTQEEVYHTFKDDLLGSVSNGYNYCLMAYG